MKANVFVEITIQLPAPEVELKASVYILTSLVSPI